MERSKLIIIIAIAIVALIVVIAILKKWFKYVSHKKEIQEEARNRIREESLDQMILNVHNPNVNYKQENHPYDISYESGNAIKRREQSKQLMVRLEEKNELSTKKFMLNPANIIRIGSNVVGNDIIVAGDKISEYQCEIFQMDRKVFLRDKDSGFPTILKRKRDKVVVDTNGIRLLSGDVIMLGKITYKVTLID